MAPLFNIAADAARAFAVLEGGGIAIVPNTIGYSILGGSPAALARIFRTKGRAAGKRNALVANAAWQRALHVCSSRGQEIIEALRVGYDLPLGAIAPLRGEHPAIAGCDPQMLADSTREGTIAMLLNAGPFHAALTALSFAAGRLLFGSSANLTLSGTRFCVEEIQPDILAIADIVIDHGLQRYHPYAASSTLLDVETLRVVRHGSCFEDIAYVLHRHFGIELARRGDGAAPVSAEPPRPG
ncbi:MAG: Sua5/YciO/YrdC/YwlC family protein [Rhodospirillales bacterium]|nr:Sua5/YciO/YrdC/YwlC family protein [Rhodospirillales bacterium]